MTSRRPGPLVRCGGRAASARSVARSWEPPPDPPRPLRGRGTLCGHEGPLFPAGGRAAGAGPPFTSRAVPGPGRTPPPTSGGCVGGRAGPGQPAATPGAVSALPRRKGPLSSRGHPPLPPPSGPTSRGLCGMLCPCCGICASVWGLEGDYYSYLLLIIIYSPPPPPEERSCPRTGPPAPGGPGPGDALPVPPRARRLGFCRAA